MSRAIGLVVTIGASSALLACFDPASPQTARDGQTNIDSGTPDGNATPDGSPPPPCTPGDPEPVSVIGASVMVAEQTEVSEITIDASGPVDEVAVATFATPVQWLVYERSPENAGDYALLASTSDGLHVIPTSSIDPGPLVIAADVDNTTRPFDLAFEQTSGEILAVYASDDAAPVFRRYTDSWSMPEPVPIDDCLDGREVGLVPWIELVARPGTDDIAAGMAVRPEGTAREDLCLLVWDGASWSAPYLAGRLAENQDSKQVDWRGFDMVWPGTENLVAAWTAHQTEDAAAHYMQFPPAADAVRDLENRNKLSFVDLAEAGDGCRIAGAFVDYGDPNERLFASVWTDGIFGAYPEVDDQIREVDTDETEPGEDAAGTFDFPAATFWYGGAPVIVYSDQGGDLDFAVFSANGWQQGEGLDIFGKAETESVRVAAHPAGEVAFAAVSDANGFLFTAAYDGDWTLVQPLPGTAIASDLPVDSVAFDIEILLAPGDGEAVAIGDGQRR